MSSIFKSFLALFSVQAQKTKKKFLSFSYFLGNGTFLYFLKKKLFLYFGKWNFLVPSLKNSKTKISYTFMKKVFLTFPDD